MDKPRQEYLGDGVYVERRDTDPRTLLMYTSNGIRATNTIYLEPEVLHSFLQYIHRQFPDYKFS